MPNRWSSRACVEPVGPGENRRTATPSASRWRPVWTSWFSPPPGAWNANDGRVQQDRPGAARPLRTATVSHGAAGPVASSRTGRRLDAVHPVPVRLQFPPPQPLLQPVGERGGGQLVERRDGLPVERLADGVLEARDAGRRSSAGATHAGRRLAPLVGQLVDPEHGPRAR